MVLLNSLFLVDLGDLLLKLDFFTFKLLQRVFFGICVGVLQFFLKLLDDQLEVLGWFRKTADVILHMLYLSVLVLDYGLQLTH